MAKMENYRIALADDNAVVRQGLRRSIEEVDDLEVSGEARDGVELLDLLRKSAPNMVVLDMSMPNFHGIETIREIKTIYPDVKILVLTMHKEHLHQALSTGVDGYMYILKEDADKEIFYAIEQIRQGKVFLSPRLTGEILGDRAPILDPLSAREKEVLKLIAEGKMNKEIANILFVSVRTVESHRASLISKLKLKNTVDIVKYAMKKGYI